MSQYYMDNYIFATEYGIRINKSGTNTKMVLSEILSPNKIVFIQNQDSISRKSKFYMNKPCTETDLDVFAENIDKLDKDCILVSAIGARPIPSSLNEKSFNKIINCDKILVWYTQNYDGTVVHDKLKHYPLGFPIVSRFLVGNKETTITNMLRLREEYAFKKENKIFSDVHLIVRPGPGIERKEIKKELCGKTCDHLVMLNERINVKNIHELYAKYKFVISTHGIGLDCYRTWEVFMLGGIVITKHSPLDGMYSDLPVIFVDNWSDVLDPVKLNEWSSQVEHLISDENILPKMKRNYWIKNID